MTYSTHPIAPQQSGPVAGQSASCHYSRLKAIWDYVRSQDVKMGHTECILGVHAHSLCAPTACQSLTPAVVSIHVNNSILKGEKIETQSNLPSNCLVNYPVRVGLSLLFSVISQVPETVPGTT